MNPFRIGDTVRIEVDNDGRISGELATEVTARAANGILIRCYSGEPPPNCKIEEYEEKVPSHYTPETIVKKRRIICPQSTPPLSEDSLQPTEPGFGSTAHADNAAQTSSAPTDVGINV